MSIKFENTEVVGWEAVIRGMRNPMNSWEKSDSIYHVWQDGLELDLMDYNTLSKERRSDTYEPDSGYRNVWLESLGPNDLALMMRLRNAGTDHRKFMRMIVVYVDITAPLYWWKEFDTYKVGTVANSCSTMHKIADKEFTLDDFSCEHLTEPSVEFLLETCDRMNRYRDLYLNGFKGAPGDNAHDIEPKSKDIWWQMIQLLPSSYNQKRTVEMNYEVLANIYKSRKKHKLDEWSKGFISWIEILPYSELITGEGEKTN